MSYLTFNKLNSMPQTIQKSLNGNTQFNKQYTVFLSHRHTDKEAVKKAVGFLAQFGQKTYIDWLDHSMPSITSSETADKLKNRITKSNKFVLLATPKSLESIWIPWELGIADGVKGLERIAILPLVNNDTNWDEREYYGLYNYIEQVSDGRWGVFKQGESTGVPLESWFEV
ncbi:toll/interleukin-1 receptor domain-containing protein [Paenibacillus polymyxa]|uniref:toll/interleukin-1 receptor domain-containing protein n=1 Tax=Paenibacillus polymyxa TaxID=1406 RepID=UPI0023F7DF62|nr:toll/interleukin-1 receptor domain-containing protein [Paenibacillus polymyxa]